MSVTEAVPLVHGCVITVHFEERVAAMLLFVFIVAVFLSSVPWRLFVIWHAFGTEVQGRVFGCRKRRFDQ